MSAPWSYLGPAVWTLYVLIAIALVWLVIRILHVRSGIIGAGWMVVAIPFAVALVRFGWGISP